MRAEIKNSINNMYICAARVLSGETLSLAASKKLFPPIKKRISVVLMASDSDYNLISAPIKTFSYADEICLSLHRISVPCAEKDLEEFLYAGKDWVDKINRFDSPLGYTYAVKKAVEYAKQNHNEETLSIIIDADACRTGENCTVKSPSLAKLQSDGSIPGFFIKNSTYEEKGGRKQLFRTEEKNPTQITPTPEEIKEIILTLANIGIRMGYGMMIFPMKNNWEDYAKGGKTPFQQGLNGGGVRIFLNSLAFTTYEKLKSEDQEEDYRTNVFLAEMFKGRTAFVPRFFSISYVVLWGNKTITRSKVSGTYRRYLERQVIKPLQTLGLSALIVGGKGEKSASVPRLTRSSAKLI